MIITQIRAENILRYAKLHLSKLPPVGLIGISGPNESGKTSIVEIVCLALFGRTSTVEATQLTKIIKWGQFSARYGSISESGTATRIRSAASSMATARVPPSSPRPDRPSPWPAVWRRSTR